MNNNVELKLSLCSKTCAWNVTLVKDLEGIERKATLFWMELHYNDPDPIIKAVHVSGFPAK